MGLGRRYQAALAVAVLAAGGYFGVTQIKAAEDRADARAQAAEDARDAAEQRAFQAKASALISKLPRPVGFKPTEGAPGNPCQDSFGVASCFLTGTTPRPALDAYLDAIRPLGLVLQKNDCVVNPQVSARAVAIFGKTPPCNAYGKLGGLSFSATAFPQLDHARSTKGHTVFSGTRVSFSLIHV